MAKIPGPAAAAPNLLQGARMPGRAHFVPIPDARAHEAPHHLEDDDADMTRRPDDDQP